ncbi:MAG: hypothetical protein ACXIUO_13765 [Erythrobacter sp.]
MAAKATASSPRPRRRTWALWMLLAIGLGLVAVFIAFREPIRGYSGVSTAYSARVACSCRFVAGRSLADCAKDKLSGMELVTLVDDPAARSVTARFPLMASTTATYREGYGCVLEKWAD